MEHTDVLASVELKEAPPYSSSSEDALVGTVVPMEEKKHDKAAGLIDYDTGDPCATIQRLIEAIADDRFASPKEMTKLLQTVQARVQEKLNQSHQKVQALEAKVLRLQQKKDRAKQERAIDTAMNASPMTTSFLSRLLTAAEDKEDEENNGSPGLRRTSTVMQQPMMKAAAGDAMEFFRDGPHAWLHSTRGEWAVVVWQVLMYVAVGALVLGTSFADGVCVDTSSGRSRASVNRGSWNTGLLVALGKQLWWGRESKVVAMVEEQVAGFMPVFAALAALQVLDLSGWLPASSNGSTERICSYILDRDTELLTIAWTGVCVIGWTFAWDIIFAMGAGRSHRVTFLSLLNPLVLAPFQLAKAMDILGEENDSLQVPPYFRYPLWILVKVIFGIPVLLGRAVLSAMGLDEKLESKGVHGLMSSMILLPFYLITCGLTDSWGLAGVSTAMIFVAIGGLSLTVSMDRALWMIWWLLLLLVFPHRLEDALTSDGFRDQGEVVALIVIIAYLSGPSEEVEESVGGLRWWEPFGVAVAWLKGLSTTSVVDMDQGSALRVAAAEGNTDVVKHILARSPEAIHGVDSNQRTALMLASQKGHRTVAEVLVAAGVAPKPKRTGWSALWRACLMSENHAAEVHVAAGADVNAKDNDGLTALMLASEKGHKDVAEVLVAAGADMNAEYNGGSTALLLAFEEGHKDVAVVLVAAGADLNAKNNRGLTALMLASRSGHKDFAEVLIAAGADVNAKGNWTALILASGEGHGDVAEVLVAAGADVNAKDNNDRSTALLWASRTGHKDVAEVLVAAGADVNAKNNSGRTALMLASEKGHKNVAEVLVAAGADLNAKDNAGETALMLASGSGHKDFAEVLIAAGADMNAKSNTGETALILASGSGHKDFAEALVAAGADVNAKANDGWTALMMASGSGHKDVAEMIVAAGADVNAKYDINGWTALMKASYSGHQDVAEVLVAAGADVNAKNNYGSTAREIALKEGHRDVADILTAAETIIR